MCLCSGAPVDRVILLSALRLALTVCVCGHISTNDTPFSEFMYSGSTSWSMEELFGHTEESRPRWWWLHAQKFGLYKNEAVEQKIIASDSLKLRADVIIGGRIPELANGMVCQEPNALLDEIRACW